MFSGHGAHFWFETCHRPICVLGLVDAIDISYRTNDAQRKALRAAVISECSFENGVYHPR